MTLDGVVQNGTVVLENGATLPDGTRVRVIAPDSAAPRPTFQDLLELAGTVNDLPDDMAMNHDHYLHGHAKR